VRRVDVTGGLKLANEAVFEYFVFGADNIKLLVHHPLSKDLYAFGEQRVRQLYISGVIVEGVLVIPEGP